MSWILSYTRVIWASRDPVWEGAEDPRSGGSWTSICCGELSDANLLGWQLCRPQIT